MTFVALSCPQCSAPLPRIALWRAVKCASCGALITRTESLVTRESFRQAWNRAGHELAKLDGVICAGVRYQLLQDLGSGALSRVHLARRLTSPSLLATVKISAAPGAPARLAREAQVVRELQALAAATAGGYFARLLPESFGQGRVEGPGDRHALILRHSPGFWGSLDALSERFSTGLDPRHAVWIWRRLLEVLNFLHRHGWAHGDLRPEHALVHAPDHAVRLIGWATARAGAGSVEQARDLQRSAGIVQVLLCGAGGSGTLPGGVPEGLAQLVGRALADAEFCRTQGAEGLDGLLQAEARTAFGPPVFVPLEI